MSDTNRHTSKTDRKAKGGRPSKYTAVVVDEICQRLANGEGLVSICKSPHLPHRDTVLSWLRDDSPYPEFSDRYARAREAGLDWHAEHILTLADRPLIGKKIKRKGEGENSTKEVEIGDNVQRTNLMIEARKWLLAKLSPKKYGDRKIVQGDDDADPLNMTFTLDIGNKDVKDD